jgi:hypothetical protein
MTEVPVPPFDDPSAAAVFHRGLMERLGELTEPVIDEDGVQHRMSPAAAAAHRPATDGFCLEDRQRYPCRSAVHTALFVELPVAWTPEQLAGALSATRLWDSDHPNGDVVEPGLLRWGDHLSGPEWKATRRPDGSWTVELREERRNTFHHERDLPGDDAMVDHLIRAVVPHPFRRPGSDARK